MTGVLRQDRLLAVEEKPVAGRCAGAIAVREADLGIDPRRTDSGVDGRLVEGFARQLGGQGRAGERRQGNTVCPTLPAPEASYDLRA